MPVHAVVLGGGLAGTLAAVVLARHADAVTIVEQDHLPDGPEHRRGLPQGHHTHVLLAGGAVALDQLLPGTTAELYERGAQHIGMAERFVALTPHGWTTRFPDLTFLISCTRPLLDHVVRTRALAAGAITVRAGSEAVGLLGDAKAVTGVRVRDRETGAETSIDADFVVDATGFGSEVSTWLQKLGLPSPTELVIDPQTFYASRAYRAPWLGEDWPEINIGSDPRRGHVRGGVVVPVEGGGLIATLVGGRDNRPPTDDEGFLAYARSLRHGIIADVLEAAEPVGPARAFRIHGNHRRQFDAMPAWPRGLAVVGDAACTFNPVYGHGMATAARGALALDSGLRRHGGLGGDSHAIQREIGKVADMPWSMASRQDLRYPTTIGPRPDRAGRLAPLFLDRLAQTATDRRAVAAAQLGLFTLTRSPLAVLNPRVVLGTLLGPRTRGVAEPPLSPAERDRIAKARAAATE
jgi:2-polyprenyl-6-methoxyphenol hydroxylase-like FAD-dependent oxidoreductase